MKKLASLLCLLSLFAAVPARAVIDTLDNVPSATLLLPYFAIDLVNPNERTLARVGNVSGNEVLAHAVLWTDRGVPTFSFDLRLAAHDVAEIDLRALFANGTLPQTSAGGFASCAATLPPPTIPAATQTALRNAHRGLASALLGGNCGGVNHSDNVARGYMTLDVVNQCSTSATFPVTASYFVAGGNGIARNDNVLFGEYSTFDGFLGTAQGDTLVAIEASDTDPATDGPDNQVCSGFSPCPVPTPFTYIPDYTFYRRVIGSPADNREGLPQRWFGRYQNDAPSTRTTALVWRDPGAVTPFPCGNPPAGLTLQLILAFDEQENPAQNCPLIGSLPYAAQAVDLSDPSKINVPFKGGFIAYGLQRTQAEGDLTIRNQGFVTHVLRRQWAAAVPLLPPSLETGQLPAWPLRPISDIIWPNDIQASCPQCADGIDNDGDGQIDFPNDLQCLAPSGIEQPECSDGIDNDGDGKIDWPTDPECWGPADRLEAGSPQCDDGIDNDGDGLIDWPSDPRCFQNPFQPFEREGTCGDGIDNDLDGKTDYPADPGCTSRTDNNETDPQCRDGIDNDGDGLIDYPNDPGCQNANSDNENPQCNDGLDNDGDGKIDLADPACTAAYLNLEGPQCSDGLENDGDGLIDYPADPGCASGASPTESPQCNDGFDNDGDGLIDFPADPSCLAASDTSENTPQCSDGKDNDGNGLIDWPNDPGCSSSSDNSEVPDCQDRELVGFDNNTNPPTPIYFNIDNDLDGLANYPDDPGCASPNDYNEFGGTTTRQCSDGIDNDGDGRVDYPRDSGCSGRGDDLEYAAGDTLAPSPPPAPFVTPAPIPGLSQLGLLIATALLALAGLFGFRRATMRG